MDSVRHQYEQYPYPPIGAFALPSRTQGDGVRFETGTRLCLGTPRPHRGTRILVAGAGTIEALVVAQANPEAACVVAVDLSDQSMRLLERRVRWARATRFFHGAQIAPISCTVADLFLWEPTAKFDFILASNMLQHVVEPAELLARLAGWLNPDGVMRIVTYPKQSRLWMREVGRWLKIHGLSAGDRSVHRRAFDLVATLPDDHPVRSCFMSHQEIATDAGVVDAFLHACENPLRPLEWKAACANAGLELCAEVQTQTSRSSFLDDIAPEARALDAWAKLEVLDGVLELCANPALWLRPTLRGAPASQGSEELKAMPSTPRITPGSLRVPSRVRFELRRALERASSLSGVDPAELVARLVREVGPRVMGDGSLRVLPGLAIVDYSPQELLTTEAPWQADAWANVPVLSRLKFRGKEVRGDSVVEQVEWLQVRYGPFTNHIDVELSEASS